MRSLVVTVSLCLALCALLVGEVKGHPAWGIAVDRKGQVYFSDLKRVWKIDAEGKLSVLRAGGDWHVHDLNVDEDGNLYGADNSYEPSTKRFFSAIWKITPAGTFSYILPTTDSPPNGTSIWKDRAGNTYYVTSHPRRELLVLRRSPGGEVSVLIGDVAAARKYRQGTPYGTSGMALDGEGALYFTHGASVNKLTTGGRLVVLARNLTIEGTTKSPARGTSLFGLTVDDAGEVFVADYGNRRVLKISPDGKKSTVIRSEGPWYPTGVAARGRAIYVLEEAHTPSYMPDATRVRRLSADGTVEVLATIGNNAAAAPGPTALEASTEEKPVAGHESSPKGPLVAFVTCAGLLPACVIGWLAWRSSRTASTP